MSEEIKNTQENARLCSGVGSILKAGPSQR